MAAPPMLYRAPKSGSQQYVASFPPPVYYRDTFGLQPVVNERKFTDSIASECSDDSSSIATKSTVKTTMNIFHPATNNYPANHMLMQESQYTDVTQQSNLQVEEILTNQVLIIHARLLLILSLVAFGTAVQLLVFSVICLFFDGAPYYICLIASGWFTCNAFALLFFIRRQHSREMLITCLVCTSVTLVVCVLLFFWTTLLIQAEDQLIRQEDQLLFSLSMNTTAESKIYASNRAAHDLKAANHIIRNTRMTMYSLHLVFSLIEAACCAAIFYILYKNQRCLIDGKVSKGYFFSQPVKNQTVLVPITLRQVRGKLPNPNDDEEDDVDSTSIGVQTSGGYVGSSYSRRRHLL